MSLDTERIIGTLQEHKEGVNRRFDEMREDMASVYKEIRSLNEFKWKWAGGFAVVLFVMNASAWLVGVLLAGGR